MSDYGKTYCEIRKSKGITQSEICKDFISRTSLSKFENGKVIPSVQTFIELINRIDVSFNEFLYINQGYRTNEKQRILNQFYSLFSNNEVSKLLGLKNECLDFQEKSFSKTIDLLVYIIDSLIELSKNNKKVIPCFPKILLTVPWEDMQNYLWWNIDDIKLINCCLYLFPTETAISIANQLVIQLRRYNDFENTAYLECAIHLNIVLLCLQNQQFKDAETTLELVIPLAKKIKRSDYYSMAIARKSFLCKDKKLLKKSLQIANLFDDQLLFESIKKEEALFF